MLQPGSGTLIWLLLDLRRKASDVMQGTATAEKAKSPSRSQLRAAVINAITYQYLYASHEGDTNSLCAAQVVIDLEAWKIGEQELQDPMLGTDSNQCGLSFALALCHQLPTRHGAMARDVYIQLDRQPGAGEFSECS